VQKKMELGAHAVSDGLPAPARYWAMAAILTGIALSVLDSTLVNLALPDITRDFGASPAAAVWVVNAYQLATLGLLLPCAQLGERVGYRRVYLAGCGCSPRRRWGACSRPRCRRWPARARCRRGRGRHAGGERRAGAPDVPSELLGRGIALNSVVVATSSVAGPSIAAVVLSVASWPWLFLIHLPAGIALLWIARRALPFNPPGSRGAGVRLSEVAMNIAMFSLVFLGADALGARRGGAPDARMVGTGVALLALGAVVGWFYVRGQLRQPAPLLPVDLLRIPVFALSMCTSITAFAAHTLAFVALPFMLLEGQGRSHFAAGC